MRARLAALPTLLLVLAGVLQATRALDGAPASEIGSPSASKLAQAERVVVYALTTTDGPRFRLPGGPEVIQLILHLELPRVLSSVAPTGSYRFGVIATLRGPDGAVLWERSVTQRTRQTKSGRRGEGWDYEAAFVPGGRMELSDSGSLELALPTVPDGAVLELRLAGAAGLLTEDGSAIAAPIAGPTALVRAYRRISVDAGQAELRRLALAGDAGGRRLASASYLPWYALAPGQQRQRLTIAWERLAAEGRAGVDYQVRSVYVAPPRPPVPPAPEEPALTIGRGQPVVVQVHGPGAIELRAWATGPLPEDREATVELRLRRLGPAVALAGADGEVGAQAVPGDRSGAEAQAVPGDRSGARAVPGDRSGTEARSGPGDRSGGGAQAGPGDRSGAQAGPGDRSTAAQAGPGDRSGVGAQAGPGGRSAAAGPGDRSGSGAAAAEIVQVLVLRAGEVGRTPIALEPGWWSLELHTDLAAVAVQVRADAAWRHVGADDHALHRDAAGRPFVPVDLRAVPVYPLGPGLPPLPIGLTGEGADVDARLVQVDVRAWGTLRQVPVRYSFVDAAGAELVAGDALAETTLPAPFERLRRPPAAAVGAALASEAPAREAGEDVSELLPGLAEAAGLGEDVLEAMSAVEGAVGGALGFPLGHAPVSEPVTLRLLAPPGAALLRVWTDEPALVAVRGRLPPPEREPEARWTWPYDQLAAEPLRWRYAPQVAPRGFPRRSDDHAARVAAGQLFTILAQLRAEDVPEEQVVAGQWQAVQPRGAHARLRVLEKVPAARRGATLADWGPGDYMRLRRGEVELIDLAGLRPARAWYQASGSGVAVVGGTMALTVGGQALRWQVTSRSGRKPLPGRRLAELRWTEGPPEMIVMVDRRPLGPSGAPLYTHRQVHRLARGGLTLQLDKPDEAPTAVNVVVYWLEGAPRDVTRLEVEIDGGSPRRRVGAPVTAVTPGVRTIDVLPARRTEVVFADRRGVSGASLARVGIVLGDDLAPGKHSVRITPAGGPPVWLRFFRAGHAISGGDPLQWNERRDGVTLQDSDDAEE